MADQFIYAHSQSGPTLYMQVRRSNGNVWNGSTWEAYNGSNWGNYDVSMAEQGSSGVYTGEFPELAAGVYVLVVFEQLGGSPAEGDPRVGIADRAWDGTGFVDTSDILSHGDSAWATVAAATISGAVLTTPANKLACNAQGEVVASNMRGTDGAYSGTPPTVNQIAQGVWEYGTRALTTMEGFVSAIAAAVWNVAERTLTAFGFEVTATDVAAVKAVTDKLDDTLENDGGVYRFTENALEQSPCTADATEANQDTIIAAIGALNDPSAADVATTILAATVDGAIDVQTALKYVFGMAVGKVVKTGADPVTLEVYAADNTTVLLTLTIETDGSQRTRS
jgi:hypothetical protein